MGYQPILNCLNICCIKFERGKKLKSYVTVKKGDECLTGSHTNFVVDIFYTSSLNNRIGSCYIHARVRVYKVGKIYFLAET